MLRESITVCRTIYLWSSTYFAEKTPPRDLPPRSESSAWPVSYFSGLPKISENSVHDSNIYYGFPSEESLRNSYQASYSTSTYNSSPWFHNQYWNCHVQLTTITVVNFVHKTREIPVKRNTKCCPNALQSIYSLYIFSVSGHWGML